MSCPRKLAAEHAPQQRLRRPQEEAPSAEVPSESVFESVVSKWNGEIPFPPERLIQKINQTLIETLPKQIAIQGNLSAFSIVKMKHSRSLEREFATPESPRVLGAVHSLGQYTFIGCARLSGQAEIISWNPGLRRYDFLILQNYNEGASGKKKVRIVRPERALCTSCHQFAGPIFPRSPWSGSNFA